MFTKPSLPQPGGQDDRVGDMTLRSVNDTRSLGQSRILGSTVGHHLLSPCREVVLMSFF